MKSLEEYEVTNEGEEDTDNDTILNVCLLSTTVRN